MKSLIRIGIGVAALGLFAIALAPSVIAQHSKRAEADRLKCQALYDRASSAALILSMGSNLPTTHGDHEVYSAISAELGNTPYISADAQQLFCDAPTLTRVTVSVEAMETLTAGRNKQVDPSTVKLQLLKRRLDAIEGSN